MGINTTSGAMTGNGTEFISIKLILTYLGVQDNGVPYNWNPAEEYPVFSEESYNNGFWGDFFRPRIEWSMISDPANINAARAWWIENYPNESFIQGYLLTKESESRNDITITESGITGNRTINKLSGSVNFGANDIQLVVTNSMVTEDSLIQVTVASNDANMTSASVVAENGSFTLYPNAVPDAETRVNFTILK